MRLEQSFEDFQSNTVSLDNTRLQRVQSAHNTVRTKLEAVEAIKALLVGMYLQGSYALHTAIRPCSDDSEYDVDLVLALNLLDENDRLYNGYQVLQWLADHLNSISLYKDKVEILTHCVRVKYASDGQRFHLDILPAHRPETLSGSILIPPDWTESDPRGFKDWLDGRKKRCERVKHLVRLLKYWRNLQYSNGIGPNSMVLTTLVGLHAPKSYKSLDDALVKTMVAMNDWFQDRPAFEQIEVENPSLSGENLARKWSWFDFSTFRTRFADSTALAQEALACKDEEETIALWNSPELFDGKFPKTVRGLGEEAKSAAAAMSNGGLFVGTTGIIGRHSQRQSISVPNNRGFYGKKSR